MNQNLLKDLDYSIVQQCMHCGMCLPTCPTYVQTLQEKNSPRGRISLMRAIADDRMDITRDFAEEMYYCLGCLACETACPAGVNYSELIEMARAESERRKLLDSPWRRFIRWFTMRFLFFSQSRLRLLGKLFYLYQAIGFQDLARELGLMRLLPKTFRELEPLTPDFQPKHSAQLIREWESPKGKVSHRVALLTGCVQDIAFSDVNRDTADVLLANGCEIWTPPNQGCCGSLHAHNGELEWAREIARKNLDLFLPAGKPHAFDAIITNAGGCGSHLKKYSHLLHGDSDYFERAKEWDRLVKDAHEFLCQIGLREPLSTNTHTKPKLAYHEACHLSHGQKITKQPRTILASLKQFELVDLPESNWCCGSAGVYNITQPESSALLLDRKMEHVSHCKAHVVTTSNPGCMIQIRHGAKKQNLDLRVAHPMTLLAEAYRNEIP